MIDVATFSGRGVGTMPVWAIDALDYSTIDNTCYVRVWGVWYIATCRAQLAAVLF